MNNDENVLKINKSNNVVLFIAAFFIPIIVMTICYIMLEVYPFGEKSLLSMDLWGQYYPMIKGYCNDLASFENYGWSWDGALGFNLAAQNYYYCNSIFYKILLFFKDNGIINGINFIIFIKYGFFSVSFLSFLKYKYKEVNMLSVAFATAYSLCTYSLAFLNQPMWTDCIILFPLVLIGLDRLIYEKKSVFYTLILAFTIYTNFYISFSICLFVGIYFIVQVINSDIRKKELIKTIVNFAVHSILAGGIVAFCIFTIVLNISERAEDAKALTEISFYHSYADVFKAMFIFPKLSYEYFVPNIYSGMFVIPFFGLFLGNDSIKLKRKIVYSVLVVFLFLSINLNLLDYIWHGLHFPNQLPGRWTFIFSFIMLMLAYEGIKDIGKINLKQVILIAVFFILFHFIAFFAKETTEKVDVSANITLILGLVYIFIAFLTWFINKFKQGKFPNFVSTVSSLICILIISEIAVSSCYSAKTGIRTGTGEQNYFFDESMKEVNKTLEKDKEFFRVEMSPNYTFDSGQLYDYNGISYYSSTMNGNVYNLLENLGNRVYTKNLSSVYNANNTFNNCILGVKYIIDRDKSFKQEGYETIKNSQKYNILLNKNYMPVSFPVNDELLQWNTDKTISPFDFQNDFIKKATGNDVNIFEYITPIKSDIINAEDVNNSDNWHERYYKRINSGENVKFDFEYNIEKDGDYFIAHNFKAGELVIRPEGKNEIKITQAEPIKFIGQLKKGTTVKVTTDIKDIYYGLWQLDLYKFDEQLLNQSLNDLKKGGFVTESAKQNNIKGTVEAYKDNQLFFTSIPDDGGWSVYCDGEKIDFEKIAGSLIAFKTSSGKHNIEFSYSVPGYSAGVFVSLISVIILIALNYKEKIIAFYKKYFKK